MSYFGAAPTGNFISTASQRVTGSTNNYVDLDHAISALSDVIVLVNSVKQDITNLTFTSASRITLGGTLVSSDVVEIIYLGKSVATQTPGTGTVTLDMLSASGTKSSSRFLRGDNTFASAGLSNWSENSGNLLPSNASYGIYLGVNSATSTNLLHDYEEGTWTPIYNADQGYNTSFTYSTQAGNYTKIGKLVFASFRITATAGVLNGGGGGARIDGLPFDVHDTGEFSSWGGGSAHFFNNMGGNYQAIFFMARGNFDGMYVNGNTSNSDDITYTITNTHIQNNTTLSGQIVYMTDA